MSREIKFRAWSADTGEMIPWEDAMFPEWFDDAEIHVMQFTGLQDKKCVDIYEGDIVRYPENSRDQDPLTIKREVEFTDAQFEPVSYMAFVLDTIEVIGNIHENPDLLDGE